MTPSWATLGFVDLDVARDRPNDVLPFFSYNGHCVRDVVSCSQALVDAIRLREFNGTAQCSRFDSLPLFNPFASGIVATVSGIRLVDYLTLAGRSREASWVAAHYEGLRSLSKLPRIGYTMFVKE